MLNDVFAYRVSLGQEQFFETGFAERKIMLVLDIYDFIKRVRKTTKIEKTLAARDSKHEYACPMAKKDYGLVDHKMGVAKELQFKMNA